MFEEQNGMTASERLFQRLDVAVFQITKANIRTMSEAMELDSDQIEQRYREWLFILTVPNAPINPDEHWREVHSLGPEWCGLARIGVRCAWMGTSEAEVERLLPEQKQIQGMHGVNYGTETLHARLVIRRSSCLKLNPKSSDKFSH
jgi:hypothetical protein